LPSFTELNLVLLGFAEFFLVLLSNYRVFRENADDALSFYEENGGGAAPAADFSLLPLRSMAERLAGDEPPTDAADAADEPPTDAADAADEAPEAPQPLEPIRQALEASLLTMAGKLQVCALVRVPRTIG